MGLLGCFWTTTHPSIFILLTCLGRAIYLHRGHLFNALLSQCRSTTTHSWQFFPWVTFEPSSWSRLQLHDLFSILSHHPFDFCHTQKSSTYLKRLIKLRSAPWSLRALSRTWLDLPILKIRRICINTLLRIGSLLCGGMDFPWWSTKTKPTCSLKWALI